jgi:hypothetical protein
MQIGHVAVEELDIGPAHADPLDADDDLTRRRNRVPHLTDLRPVRGGDHERSHP